MTVNGTAPDLGTKILLTAPFDVLGPTGWDPFLWGPPYPTVHWARGERGEQRAVSKKKTS